MRIDFYYWEECPSHEEALSRLRQVLINHGVSDAVALHDVTTDDEAEALKFPGSPTIRIDGDDIDPAGDNPADGYGLTCRVYRTPEGRITPLPPAEMIRQRVAAALGRA